MFAGVLPSSECQNVLIEGISLVWDIQFDRSFQYIKKNQPTIHQDENLIYIGRSHIGKKDRPIVDTKFAQTGQSLRILERLCCCINNNEPILLVGETGCGKTTTIQYLAKSIGKEMIVTNLNEQTETSDLVGGYKPMEIRHLVIPIYVHFCNLFEQVFNKQVSSFLVDFYDSRVMQSS